MTQVRITVAGDLCCSQHMLEIGDRADIVPPAGSGSLFKVSNGAVTSVEEISPPLTAELALEEIEANILANLEKGYGFLSLSDVTDIIAKTKQPAPEDTVPSERSSGPGRCRHGCAGMYDGWHCGCCARLINTLAERDAAYEALREIDTRCRVISPTNPPLRPFIGWLRERIAKVPGIEVEG